MATHLQSALIGLFERCKEVEIADYEDAPVERLVGEVMPLCYGLLEQGEALIIQTLMVYDSVQVQLMAPEDTGDFLNQVDALFDRSSSAKIVADLAFLARNEIVSWHQRLIDVKNRSVDADEVLGRCGECLEHLAKGCAALENAIAEHQGTPPKLDHLTETRRLVQVRRAYARLAMETSRAGRDGAPLEQRIGLARTQLGLLRGGRFWRLLPVEDRIAISHLLHRFEVLPKDDEGEEAERLWQDTAGMARLLLDINKREELLTHDRRRLREVWKILFVGDIPDSPPPQVMQKLQSVLGRHPALDAVLADGSAGSSDRWREPLQTVAAAMNLQLS